jgi:biotin operon repressor
MTNEATKKAIYNNLLTHGRDNPIKADELAGIIGVSRRDINEAVQTLRNSGVLIGASRSEPFGYYLPGSIEEAKECVRPMRSEMFSLIRTHQKTRKAFHEFCAQMQSNDLFVPDAVGQYEMVI